MQKPLKSRGFWAVVVAVLLSSVGVSTVPGVDVVLVDMICGAVECADNGS